MRRRKSKFQRSTSASAWKLAYADFVTAMMIFFLLMWLVSTSSQEEKNNLVTYFEESFSSGGAARHIFRLFSQEDAGQDKQDMYTSQDQEAIYHALEQFKGHMTEDSDLRSNPTSRLRTAVLHNLNRMLGPKKAMLRQRIFFQAHKNGTLVHLIDHDTSPFFSRGGSTLYQSARDILEVFAKTLKKFPGEIRIIGHTDAKQYRARSTYTNWELSTDRAQATRRFLFQKGLKKNITWVAGQGDKHLLFPQDPLAAANRRISLLYVPSPQNQGNDARIGKEIEHK